MKNPVIRDSKDHEESSHDRQKHKKQKIPVESPNQSFFPSGFFKVAHYIRLSDDTRTWRSSQEPPSANNDNPEVLQLFVHVWNLLEPEPPRLVISFTGDEKRFSLEGVKKKTFMAGLMKVGYILLFIEHIQRIH